MTEPKFKCMSIFADEYPYFCITPVTFYRFSSSVVATYQERGDDLERYEFLLWAGENMWFRDLQNHSEHIYHV